MASLYLEELVRQLRAVDQFGTWAKLGDDELLTKKYIRTKEERKLIPVIADIDEMVIKDIKLLFSALALAFERKTGVVCNVILEMSHEGFGRGVVIADQIVIYNKYFKDAHRYSFETIELLDAEGEKMMANAITIYEKYKPCLGGN